MPNLKSKGIHAFIWDLSGRIATNGVGFIVTIILARLLEPSEFGLIAMVMVIIGIASVFTDIGLGSALIQRRRVLSVHYSSVFYFNIVVGFILTLITYISAGSIGDFYNNVDLVRLAQVMSFAFIINAFSSVQNTILRKELNYAVLTKSRFIASLIGGVIAVLMALYGAGVWSLVAQTLITGVLYNILIWATAVWTPNLEFSWKALTQLWGFGFRMFLVGLLDAVYTRMDYLVIGKLFAPATLGFFQRAKSLNMMVIQYASGSIMSVLFPVLSKIQNDLPRFQNIVTKGLAVICFISALLFGGLYLISEELIVILFSEKWLPSVEYFKLLAVSGFAYPVNALLVNILSSRGNSKALLRMAVYKKSVSFLNIATVFFYGIEGYLYGLVVVSAINTSITIMMASRECKLQKLDLYRPIATQATIGVIAVITTLYLSGSMYTSDIVSLMTKGALFSFVFIFLNMAFKTASFNALLEQVAPIYERVLGNYLK